MAPFDRDIYDGPTTNYRVGQTIRPVTRNELFGVIEEIGDSHYTVRVDPACNHFRPTVLIHRREAITPAEYRVRRAVQAAESAAWEWANAKDAFIRAQDTLERATAAREAAREAAADAWEALP